MSRSALIYTALAAIAIAVAAIFALRDPAAPLPGALPERAALEGLRTGTMKKLVFHAAPKPAGTAAFLAEDGGSQTLADHRGHVVLVNFWATWCAPCRKEMPGLAALQSEFGGPEFEVVTIATGRNAPHAIEKFLAEIGASSLPRYRDPGQKLAREMGVFGLPVSVILDPQGREIARMTGDAEWNSDSGKAIVRALLGK